MRQYIQAICALGCRREPEQFSKFQTRQQGCIGRRSRMVKLVHNDHVEVLRVNPRHT